MTTTPTDGTDVSTWVERACWNRRRAQAIWFTLLALPPAAVAIVFASAFLERVTGPHAMTSEAIAGLRRAAGARHESVEVVCSDPFDTRVVCADRGARPGLRRHSWLVRSGARASSSAGLGRALVSCGRARSVVPG